jgi:hypothetical protein
MIDYKELQRSLVPLLGATVVLSEDTPSVSLSRTTIWGVPIHSGNFFFHEKGLHFYFFHEIYESDSSLYERITRKLNEFFAGYRLGKLSVQMKEKHRRLWLGFQFKLKLPHPYVREPQLDWYLAMGAFRDFFTDAAGYMPMWYDKQESCDYVSRWILPENQNGYAQLLGPIRIGDKLIL